MNLPHFTYHPDPVWTGSIGATDAQCECCGQIRAYTYTGPIYGPECETLCPWCIADGTAHAKLDAMFVDDAGVGGYGDWDTVPPEVVAEIAYRTPGFSGWQQEKWWTHCGDGAEFLGVAGYAELQEYGEAAVQFMRDRFSAGTGIEGEELDVRIENFDADGGPSAYVFKCRHCGKLGGYWDGD